MRKGYLRGAKPFPLCKRGSLALKVILRNGVTKNLGVGQAIYIITTTLRPFATLRVTWMYDF